MSAATYASVYAEMNMARCEKAIESIKSNLVVCNKRVLEQINSGVHGFLLRNLKADRADSENHFDACCARMDYLKSRAVRMMPG